MLTVYLSIGLGFLLANYGGIVKSFAISVPANLITMLVTFLLWPLTLVEVVYKTHHKKDYKTIAGEIFREFKVMLAQVNLKGSFQGFDPEAPLNNAVAKYKLNREDFYEIQKILYPLIDAEMTKLQDSFITDVTTKKTETGNA